jgi:hypothetical protein
MYQIVYQSNPPHAILSDKCMQDALKISTVTRCPGKAKESASAKKSFQFAWESELEAGCRGAATADGGRLPCKHAGTP